MSLRDEFVRAFEDYEQGCFGGTITITPIKDFVWTADGGYGIAPAGPSQTWPYSFYVKYIEPHEGWE